jgi:AcrR family transcriptional regulator
MRTKQINLSKKLIEKAFIKLLKKKPFHKISMTEIAKEADVVRMTLYRHFKTKEDIILSIVESKVDKLINMLSDKSEPAMYDFLLFRFSILKNSPFTETLFKHNHLDKLFAIIRKRSIGKLHFLPPDDLNPLIIEFIGGGIDAITVKWISEGMKESPQTMAKKLEKLISTIKSSLQTQYSV